MGKGKTVRQIHHFTDGLWSPDMDARADLQSSVNSCRKLENFQVDQYGEAIRRPGFQYVGNSLGECLAIDPRNDWPNWASLTDAEVISPVLDQFGLIGPNESRSIDYLASWWLLCPWLAYCDGPEYEGQPFTDTSDRFKTRWRAKLEDGNFYYARVGDPWIQVGTDLIPQPNLNAIGIGFCFDANSRPAFCTQIGSNVHIYRYVDEVPTTYSFSGVGPRLFFNGNINPDSAKRDIVCYYCSSGDLYARLQRDNFLAAYLLYHNADNYLSRVRHIDYELTEAAPYQWIAASGSQDRMMFRCGRYPLWPAYGEDSAIATASFNSDMSYEEIVLVNGPYSDSATASAGFNSDVHYQPITVQEQGADSVVASAAFNSNVSYEQVIIQTGSYADGASAVAAFNQDIDYYYSIIGPLTKAESATASAAFNSDIDYTV